MITQRKNEDGFVILFAVLISAVVLIVAFGIFSVSFKETVLSGAATESNRAFFAADTGMECALYHHLIDDAFNAGFTGLVCDGNNMNYTTSGTQFHIEHGLDNGSCTIVDIDTNVSPAPGQFFTVIESRGFNVCNGNVPNPDDPLVVERALRATIPNN